MSFPRFGDDEPRKESPGEAQRRVASWFLSIWQAYPMSLKFNSKHHDAAAILAGPFIKRWPFIGTWKAPKNP